MIYKIEQKEVVRRLYPWIKQEINKKIKVVEPEIAPQQKKSIPKLSKLAQHPAGLNKIVELLTIDIRKARENFLKFMSTIQYEKIVIGIKYGSGDAAGTAIAIGNMWFLINLLMVKLQKKNNLFHKQISCIPIYEDKFLEVDILCIFHMRMGDYINVRKRLS